MRINSRLLLILSVVILFSGLAYLVRATQTNQQSSQRPEADEHKKLVEAIRRGGFKEAAKLKGQYVGTLDPNWDFSVFDLEALVKNSAAVIVGSPEEGKGQLSATGDLISTDFDVKVQEVIKGNISSSNLKVSLPGGKVVFEDGTSAELRTPGFERMIAGKKYLLFLYANRKGSDVFLLTGGPQGLFEITPSGKIKAHGRSSDPVAKEFHDRNVSPFLEQIREYVSKWPLAQTCCN